jgi:precorrin-2 methylase
VLVSPVRVVEGTDATFTISSSTAVSNPIVVSYSMFGTARLGSDYTLSGTVGTVTIAVGQKSTAVTIHTIADRVREGGEVAILVLGDGTGYKVSTQSVAPVMILDGP